MLKQGKNRIAKYSIDIAAIKKIVWRGSGVLDTGMFISTYSGNESNTFENSFLIKRKYKQAIMNFEAVDERIRSMRMRKVE